MSDGYEDGAGREPWLHDAFGAEVATLEVDASPLAQVMRDGAALRTKRRLALVSGVTALVVLPVAAVAAFGSGAGARTGVGTVPDASAPGSPRHTSATTPPPAPITATLVPPGRNHSLPNDDIDVLAGGTYQGHPWRLVRDRYVVAGPEGDNVMDDPSQRAHLPFTANWGRHGTIECSFTGIQWDGQTAGDNGPPGGGACNPTDDGAVEDLHGARFGLANVEPHSPENPPALTISGRFDGTDAAWVAVDIDGGVQQKVPVIVVPGEKNDFFVAMLPTVPGKGTLNVTTTVYDAQGHSLGSSTSPIIR